MKSRFVALDILRGLTVAFMCIVNNPGTWAKVYAPLRHAKWIGCTPTDLVFPFFVFCAGCAMAFSLSKHDSLTLPAAGKLLKRGLELFVVGLLLNMYPFNNLGHLRIFGVLQRIAMSYVLGGFIILALRKDPKKLILAVLGLFVLYTGVLLAFGQEPGALTLEGNVSRRIDLAIAGDAHIYHGYGIPFDPEGPLGTLTCSCTVILGFLVGLFVRKSTRRHAVNPSDLTSPVGTVAKLFVAGLSLVAAGRVLGIWIPICKPLWSASYVLYAGGWATVALAIVMYLTEVLRWEKIFNPAIIMGTRALPAFVLSGLIAKTFRWTGWIPGKYFSANEFTSLVYALLFMCLIFFLQWLLYKKYVLHKYTNN